MARTKDPKLFKRAQAEAGAGAGAKDKRQKTASKGPGGTQPDASDSDCESSTSVASKSVLELIDDAINAVEDNADPNAVKEALVQIKDKMASVVAIVSGGSADDWTS